MALLDHIAGDIHNFSLRSLPWPSDEAPGREDTPELTNFQDVLDWLEALHDCADNPNPPVEFIGTSQADDIGSTAAGTHEGAGPLTAIDGLRTQTAGDATLRVLSNLDSQGCFKEGGLSDPSTHMRSDDQFFQVNEYFLEESTPSGFGLGSRSDWSSSRVNSKVTEAEATPSPADESSTRFKWRLSWAITR